MKNRKWQDWLLYLCGIIYIIGIFLRRFSGKMNGTLNIAINIIIIILFLSYVILNIIAINKTSKKQWMKDFKAWSTSKKLFFIAWVASDIYLLGTADLFSNLIYFGEFIFLNVIFWRILFGIGKRDREEE